MENHYPAFRAFSSGHRLEKPLGKGSMHMKSSIRILATLAWVGLATTLPAQDFFRTEGGDDIILGPKTVLSSMEVGEFHVPIQFQSVDFDKDTGKSLPPDYRAVYSLHRPGTPATNQGIPWVFGQTGRWLSVKMGDFDEKTGQGTAWILCPVNMSTVDGMWGITWGDTVNELTVYWGTASALAHDRFTPPSGPQVGSKRIRFSTKTPPLALMWEENRSMRMDRPTRIMLLAKTVSSSDRTFKLISQPAGFFDLPSTVILPAGKGGVAVPVTPRYVGSGTIRAIGDKGEALVSSRGDVHRPVRPASSR